jgi:hypothetical protein
MSDPLIEEQAHHRRARMILVIATVLGILAGAGLGVAATLGAFDTHGASGHRNPALFIFFIGPVAVSMAVGWLLYKLVARR